MAETSVCWFSINYNSQNSEGAIYMQSAAYAKVVGDRKLINLTSSQFDDFIQNRWTYVDKTMFIEHIIQDPGNVLLFTRPRRMGKSLNMNMLATFLDSVRDTAGLFKGLYVEKSPVFGQINKTPVIYISFIEFELDDYKRRYKSSLRKITQIYLKPDEISTDLQSFFSNDMDVSSGALKDLIENIHQVHGIKPYVIIDEYDRLLVASAGKPEYNELRDWLQGMFRRALKDNASLGKAVLTGVTRVAKESMFSDLNNLQVYDVLRESEYDSDFALTAPEVAMLVPPDDISGVASWYNNIRVGGSLQYNVFSVMSYLQDKKRELKGYWTLTGGARLLANLFTPERVREIVQMLDGTITQLETQLHPQLDVSVMMNPDICDDSVFYTLGVQAGYFSFDSASYGYYVRIPNNETKQAWARLILDSQHRNADNELLKILRDRSDLTLMGERLSKFFSMALSYYDYGDSLEQTYHVFFLGAVWTLGIECKSNREAGFGRCDIIMKGHDFNAVVEFKTAASQSGEDLVDAVNDALIQIDKKEYWQEFSQSSLPVYKIGVACYKKKVLVRVEEHLMC